MKNILLAIVSGLLLAVSWPTYGFPLFLFVGFVPLLLAEYQVRHNRYHKSQVFGLAFLAFFIWNLITTWWIYNSTPFGMWFAEIANTLLMALVFLLYHVIARFIKRKEKSILYRSAIKNGLIIIIPILISVIILKTYKEEGQEIEVILLQPNINPYTEKYNTSDTHVGTLLSSLSAQKISKKTKFILAPETVFADNNRLTKFQNSIAKKTALNIISTYPSANFLSGISMIDVFRDPAKAHPQTNVHKSGVFYDDYNSAFFVRPDGTDELYHKSKLVVGVEHFPYQNIFKPLIGDAMIDLGGTVAKKTTQEDREVFFSKEGIGAAPIICYESVYGEFVAGYVRNKADFLAIITNDAWWGVTQGHQQHLAYAKLRAIETRRSVARSANTGISAIIDQTGNIVSSLGYNEQGALKGTLKTNDKITLYVKAGDYLARIAIFLMLFIFLFSVTRRRNKIAIL